MTTTHIPHRPHHILLVVAAAALLVACGSSKAQTLPPLTASAPGSTTKVEQVVGQSTTTTTVLTGDAAIIAAAINSDNTYFVVASSSPVNPNDPRISQVDAGKQLGMDRNSLTVLALQRRHDVGTYSLTNGRVAERNSTGTVVVVLACGTDGISVVSDATGETVTPAPYRRSLINLQMTLVSGRWMETDSGERSPTC
ncbi:MAG: hypothetical protein QOF30_1834 [Acidimicrobiaceae bacterium]|nr:hypothetical protein [Acidimicrobiaceae bacterium]